MDQFDYEVRAIEADHYAERTPTLIGSALARGVSYAFRRHCEWADSPVYEDDRDE